MIVILVVTIARREGQRKIYSYQVPAPQNKLFFFWEDFLPFQQPSFFNKKNMEKSEGKLLPFHMDNITKWL